MASSSPFSDIGGNSPRDISCDLSLYSTVVWRFFLHASPTHWPLLDPFPLLFIGPPLVSDLAFITIYFQHRSNLPAPLSANNLLFFPPTIPEASPPSPRCRIFSRLGMRKNDEFSCRTIYISISLLAPPSATWISRPRQAALLAKGILQIFLRCACSAAVCEERRPVSLRYVGPDIAIADRANPFFPP